MVPEKKKAKSMTNEQETAPNHQGFWRGLLRSIIRDIMFMVVAFLIGTLALGAVLFYYDLPLALSIVGGLVVLGFSLALKTESIF